MTVQHRIYIPVRGCVDHVEVLLQGYLDVKGMGSTAGVIVRLDDGYAVSILGKQRGAAKATNAGADDDIVGFMAAVGLGGERGRPRINKWGCAGLCGTNLLSQTAMCAVRRANCVR